MTHIVFRTDISHEAGTGHFMRSLNLACSLKERGVQISFITTELPDFFSRLLKDKHIEHYQLTTENLSQEIEEVLKLFKKFKDKPDWVVVDHYQLDERWEQVVRPWVRNIAVIDDLANRHHDCDLLIDPNLRTNGEKVYCPLVPASCQLLLGPEFALLSSVFIKKRKQISPRKGTVQNVLISFGGSDPVNETERTLKALSAAFAQFDGKVNVVVGKLNPNIPQIEKKLSSLKNAQLHVQTNQMADLMADADLAIGAGGTELWERCCLGVPSIAIATIPNQAGQLEALAKVDAIFYLGKSSEIKEDVIFKTLEVLRNNLLWLSHSSAAAMKLVDGKGAQRVANLLVKEPNQQVPTKLLYLGKESPVVDFLKISAEVIATEEPITLEMLNKLKPSFMISYNYRHILSKEVVSEYRYKIINLHCSFLPWNRGADPNFWSFIEGTPKGVTIHYIDEGVDTGEIIAQKEVSFTNSETLKTSYDKLQHELQNLFMEWWPKIKSGSCVKNRQVAAGSCHRVKDKEPLLHLIKQGWDTPVSIFENYQKKTASVKG